MWEEKKEESTSVIQMMFVYVNDFLEKLKQTKNPNLHTKEKKQQIEPCLILISEEVGSV